MILPRQAPPVARTITGLAAAPRRNGVTPAAPKIDFDCKEYQADQDDPLRVEWLLVSKLPGEGWTKTDFPCKPMP